MFGDHYKYMHDEYFSIIIRYIYISYFWIVSLVTSVVTSVGIGDDVGLLSTYPLTLKNNIVLSIFILPC